MTYLIILTSYLASYLPIWHIFWHSILHSIWHIFWHSIWPIFRHSIWQSIWHIFWHAIWHILWRDILHSQLSFSSAQCPLSFLPSSLRSASARWDLALAVEGRVRGGKVEDEEVGRRRGRMRRQWAACSSDKVQRDSHLAGGEKSINWFSFKPEKGN